MEHIELYAPTIVQQASDGALQDVRENTSHRDSAIHHIYHADMDHGKALSHLDTETAREAIVYAAQEYWNGPETLDITFTEADSERQLEVIPDFEEVSNSPY